MASRRQKENNAKRRLKAPLYRETARCTGKLREKIEMRALHRNHFSKSYKIENPYHKID